MSQTFPTCSVPRIQSCKGISAVRLLGVWAIMLASNLGYAQTSAADITNSGATTTAEITTSGATIVFNNSGLILSGASTFTGTTSLSGGTLTLSNAVSNMGTADSTKFVNGASGMLVVTDPLNLGGTLTGSNTTTTTGSATSGTSGTTGVVTDALTLGSSLTLTGGTTVLGAGALQVSSGSTLTSATNTASITYGTTTSLVNNTAYTGTLSLNAATTLSIPANIVINGSTVGTMSSGTLTLNSGGVLDLTNIINSGLNVTLGNASTTGGLTLGTTGITSTSGGLTLGTTGISITSGSTTTGSGSGTVTVTALGSLPAGNTPSSASFATPAVELIGIGNIGGQGISERGIIYSLTSANGTPTLGGSGVVKVVHTGNPTASGSFSLTAAGLAASTAYTYRVYATDSTGATYLSPPSTFTTPTVLQNWRQTFFGTTQGTNYAADAADPDGDGVPNLIEFATGKNPTSAHDASPTATTSVNGGALEYTYTRSLDALNSGTTFAVEWNDTLDPTQWSSTGVSEVILSDNGLLQQVKATFPASSTVRRFVRLKVLPPPQ